MVPGGWESCDGVRKKKTRIKREIPKSNKKENV